MIKHYFLSAWRNNKKHRGFALINVLGLAVSMAICLLIILIISDQKSYDRFHTKGERIYRINTEGRGNGFRMKPMASSTLPLAEELRSKYSFVEEAVSLVKHIGGDVFYNEKVASGGGYFASENLFSVFDFKLQSGDEATALKEPFSLVVDAAMAEQLFPHETAIGKRVRVNHTGINPAGIEKGNIETPFGDFVITGVLQNNPGKSSIPFRMLASLSTVTALNNQNIFQHSFTDWNDAFSSYTFVLLKPSATQAQLRTALNQVSDKQYPKGSVAAFGFVPQPLLSITPSNPIGNANNLSMPVLMITVLVVLGIIIMLSACFNYTNLSVAGMLLRTREVGVRKVVGATRSQVFFQFMAEAVLLALAALAIAYALVYFLQEGFSNLWLNTLLGIDFNFTPATVAISFALALFVGLLSGILPAAFISLFKPAQVFRNIGQLPGFKKLTLSKVLLTIQFALSLIFIVSALLISRQGKLMLHFDYGVNTEDVVNIRLYRAENLDRFVQAISSDKRIIAAGGCAFLPATGTQNGTQVHYGEGNTDSMHVSFIDVDGACFKVWDLKMLAGKAFTGSEDSAIDNSIIVNETMLAGLGYKSPTAAVGAQVLLDGRQVPISGVVQDFHFADPVNKTGALMLRNRKPQFGYVTIRIPAEGSASTVSFLQQTWKKVNPQSKFDYEFYVDQLRIFQSIFTDLAAILTTIAFLAVFISCLGLLGMAGITSQGRQREVSIRRVLGSTMHQVFALLSKTYATMLGIATVVALPLAWFINNLWLQQFAYRTPLSAAVLGTAFVLLLLLSAAIVLSQAWRVFTTKPSEALRKE